MRSKLNDYDLSVRWIEGEDTLRELTLTLDYLGATLDAYQEKARASKRRGSGYLYVRELDALRGAVFILRLLKERQQALMSKDKHDLFSRGYETPEQIRHRAREA